MKPRIEKTTNPANTEVVQLVKATTMASLQRERARAGQWERALPTGRCISFVQSHFISVQRLQFKFMASAFNSEECPFLHMSVWGRGVRGP